MNFHSVVCSSGVGSRVYLLSEKRRNYLVKQENVFFQRKNN